MTPVESLMLLSGIFWTVTYVLVIRTSFRDRTFAMPLLAMVMNLVWEFLYTFVYPSVGGLLQEGVNIAWFILDLGILYTYIRFWRSDYPTTLSPRLVRLQLLVLFVVTAPLMQATISLAGPDYGSVYTAYIDNLIMSALFIVMLIRRGNRRGQSLWIAWGKLLGTGAASLSQYIEGPSNPVWNVLFLEILFFDLLYVVMLTWAKPWHDQPNSDQPVIRG